MILTKKTFTLFFIIIISVLSGCQSIAASKVPKAQVSMTNGIPILMYHKVNSDPKVGGLGLRVPEEKFDWQMKYLHDHGYHTVTLGDVLGSWDKDHKLPAKPIVITFDDGYLDNLTKAYPILKKYNFTATIFIPTDYVGNYNRWDFVNGQPSNKMMTWSEIKELQAKGFDIEAHTKSHPHLAKITPEMVDKELVESKKILQDKLDKKIYFLAYPYGNHNKSVEDAVKKAGYLAAVVTDPQGKVDQHSNRFALDRVRIMGHYDNQTFVNVLSNPVEGYKLYLKNIKL